MCFVLGALLLCACDVWLCSEQRLISCLTCSSAHPPCSMCCPRGSLPVACNPPILTNIQNSPTVFTNFISIGPDYNAPVPNGQACCHYSGIWTSQQDKISVCVGHFFYLCHCRNVVVWRCHGRCWSKRRPMVNGKCRVRVAIRSDLPCVSCLRRPLCR
jgi:hypothetical protein